MIEADGPLPRYELSFPSFAARMRYLVGCHTPMPLKIAVAELVGRLDRWRYPDDLAKARSVMGVIVAGTRWAPHVEALARRRLVEERVRQAGFWRSRWDRDPVMGVENLHAALAENRGVILSFCHTGCFQGSFAPVCTEARRITYLATNAWFLEPPDGSDWGFRVEHWRRGLARIEARIVRMPGTFDILRALLERGQIVMLAFDMPGSMKMQFLGKEVMLTSGAATVALQTDAIVLPIRRARQGRLGVAVEFGPPIDAREHADAESLQSTLAAHHERWILERPAALEDPRRTGAWEHEALATGWNRPARS